MLEPLPSLCSGPGMPSDLRPLQESFLASKAWGEFPSREPGQDLFLAEYLLHRSSVEASTLGLHSLIFVPRDLFLQLAMKPLRTVS